MSFYEILWKPLIIHKNINIFFQQTKFIIIMLCIAIYWNLNLEMYTRLANYVKETRGNGWGIDHLGGNDWGIDHLGGSGGEKVKNPWPMSSVELGLVR